MLDEKTRILVVADARQNVGLGRVLFLPRLDCGHLWLLQCRRDGGRSPVV